MAVPVLYWAKASQAPEETMAVTKQSLEYRIQVETAGAKKEIDGLAGSTGYLRDAQGKFAKHQDAVFSRSVDDGTNAIDAQTAALMRQADAMGASASAYSSAVSSMGGVISAVEKVTTGLHSFFGILEKITNPETIQRLSNVLLLLSKVAAWKGMDRASEAFKQGAKGLDTYNEMLVEAGLSSKGLGEKIDEYANMIRLVDAALLQVGITSAGLAAGFAITVAKNAKTWATIKLGADQAKAGFAAADQIVSKFSSEVAATGRVLEKVAPVFSEHMAVAIRSDLSRVQNDVRNTSVEISKAFRASGISATSFSKVYSESVSRAGNDLSAFKKAIDDVKFFQNFERQAVGAFDLIYKMRLPVVLSDVKQSFVAVENAMGEVVGTTIAWTRLSPAGAFDRISISARDSSVFLRDFVARISTVVKESQLLRVALLSIIAPMAPLLTTFAVLTGEFVKLKDKGMVFRFLGKEVVNLTSAANELKFIIGSLLDSIAQIFAKYKLIGGMAGVFAKGIEYVKSSFLSLGNTAATVFSSTISATNKVVDVFDALAQRMNVSIAVFATAFQNAQATQLGFFSGLRRGVSSISFKQLLDDGKKFLSALLSAFGAALADITALIGRVFSGSSILAEAKGISQSIGRIFSTSASATVASTSKSFSALGDSILGLGKTIKEGGTNLGDAVPKTIGQLKSLGSALYGTAKDTASFAKVISTTHAGPTLVTLAESAHVLRYGLIGLGSFMLSSESTFLKFSGAVAIAAGILLGGFAYAVKVALGYIGDFITAIGDSLIASMDQFEKKFQKAQVAATNFAFTVAGMTREFGDSAGTMESWSKVVEDLSENTLIATSDAQKMAMEVMSVGHGLGLTRNQMEDLVRLIPNYVKAGDDAFDVTVSFLQALGGSSQGVLKYAVHLSDASVEHSKLAKSIGLSMDRMTEEQKVQARFNALIEQSAPILGRSSAALNTVAGSQQYLAKSLDTVQQLMGSQNILISYMNIGLAKLTTMATKLPAPFWSFLGTLQDILGVGAKVIGTFISLAFPLAALVGLFKVFSVVVATNATVQFILTKALTFTNVSLGGQALAVTSLGTLWTGFATILLNVTRVAFTSLITGMATVTKGIWTMTTAILANPLFWKTAAIVGAVLLVYNALKRIEEETKIFSEALATIVEPFGSLISAVSGGSSAISSAGKAFSVFARLLVDVTVLAVTPFIIGLYSTAAAVSALLDALTFGKVDAFGKAVEDANSKIVKLSNVMGKAGSDLFTFSETASADPMDNFNKGIQEAIDRLKGLQKELLSATEKELIWAQAAGKETKVLVLSKQLAEERMALAKDTEERKNIAKELEQVNAQIAVFPKKVIDDARKSMQQLKLESLDGMNSVEAIRKAGAIRAQQALDPLREKLADIQLLPKTADTARAARELQSLMSTTQANINADTEKKVKELQNSRVQAELDTKLEIAKMRNDELAQIQLNAEKQIAATNVGDKAKAMTAAQQAELTNLILAAKDKQIAELAAKESEAHRNALATYAQTIGDQSLIAETEYQKQLASYDELLKKKLISDEQYAKAKAALESQRDTKQTEAKLSTANKVVGAIGGGISGIVSAIGQATGPIGMLIASIVNLLNRTPEEMKKFTDGLIDAANQLPQTLAKNIPIVIRSIIEKLPDSLRSVLGTISTLFKELVFNREFWIDVVNGLIEAMVTALSDIGDWLFDGVDFSKLGKKFAGTMGDSLKAITGATSGLFSVEDIGAPFKQQADNLGKQIKDATRTATNWLGKAWDALKKAGQWLVDNVFTPVWNAFKSTGQWIADNLFFPLWDAFKQAGAEVFNTISPLLGGLTAAGDFVFSLFVGAWDTFTSTGEYVVSLLLGVWDTATITVEYMVSLLGDAWNALWEIGSSVFDLFSAAWDTLASTGDAIAGLFNGSFEGFYEIGQSVSGLFDASWELFASITEPIVSAFRGVWDYLTQVANPVIAAFEEAWNYLKSIADPIIAAFKGAWDSLKAIADPVISALNGAWTSFKNTVDPLIASLRGVWDGLKNTVSSAITPISDMFTKTIPGTLSATFKGLVDIFKGIFTLDFESVKQGFSTMVDALGKSLVNTIKAPINTIIGALNGLKIPEVNVKFTIPVIDKDVKFRMWKEIDLIPGDIARLATGGLVQGPGSLTGMGTDTVPAALTPGEFVLNRNAASSIGLPTLNAMNRGASAGTRDTTQNVEINLTINTTNGVDASTVKSKVLPVILEELRRASLEGRRVLSPAGVR